MRESAPATHSVNQEQKTRAPLQAPTQTKVVELKHYREERLAESVSAIRRRLSELQRARVHAELSAGRLLRELAALQRELRDCRARTVDSGVID